MKNEVVDVLANDNKLIPGGLYQERVRKILKSGGKRENHNRYLSNSLPKVTGEVSFDDVVSLWDLAED